MIDRAYRRQARWRKRHRANEREYRHSPRAPRAAERRPLLEPPPVCGIRRCSAENGSSLRRSIPAGVSTWPCSTRSSTLALKLQMIDHLEQALARGVFVPRPGPESWWDMIRPTWDRRYTKQGPILLLVLICAPIYAVRWCVERVGRLRDAWGKAPGAAVGVAPLVPQSVSSTAPPSAVAGRSSMCGASDAFMGARALPSWHLYKCTSEQEAGERWPSCLARPVYSDARGRGCPGAKRCCPPL